MNSFINIIKNQMQNFVISIFYVTFVAELQKLYRNEETRS